MGRRKVLVADLLRSLAGVMRDGCESKDYPIEEQVAYEWYCRMCVAADMIDAEHERRMNQLRRTYRGHIKKRAREYATKHERELERDNAKLRKLARKMLKPFYWAQSGYEVCLSDEEDREIRDMLRELRIEARDEE